MKLTNYSQLKHGMRVRCYISGLKIDDARLSINPDGNVYICQNQILNATYTVDTFGYMHAYWLCHKNAGWRIWHILVTNLESIDEEPTLLERIILGKKSIDLDSINTESYVGDSGIKVSTLGADGTKCPKWEIGESPPPHFQESSHTINFPEEDSDS
jgi:hypothetical protein